MAECIAVAVRQGGMRKSVIAHSSARRCRAAAARVTGVPVKRHRGEPHRYPVLWVVRVCSWVWMVVRVCSWVVGLDGCEVRLYDP